VEFVKEQIENVLAIDAPTSSHQRQKRSGVDDVLEAIIKRIPAPKGSATVCCKH
jgi:translation elongation factor EF-4